MCRSLRVSPSGYYAWRSRTESRRAAYDRELTRVIRRIHAESDGTYGSPRICVELKAEGFCCSRVKVARLMRKAGLKGCPKRRFRITSRGGHVIERFYNRQRRHSYVGNISPVEFEERTMECPGFHGHFWPILRAQEEVNE